MNNRILIVNIALRPQSIGRYFSVGTGYIATAMKKAGISFDIYDNELMRKSDDEVHTFLQKHIYDIYLMGTLITGYKTVKKYAGWIRSINPNAVIIAGNSVASSIPEILLRNTEVDIASLGEGDITTIELLHAIDNLGDLHAVRGIAFIDNDNQFVQTAPRPPIENLDELGFIDYSLFDYDSYIRIAATEFQEPLPVPKEIFRPIDFSTGRGCVANCTFCYHCFKELKYRKYSIPVVMAFLKKLVEQYQVTYVNFSDDLTFYSKKQVVEFCRELIRQEIPIAWTATCRANLLQDPEDVEIAKLMKESGCWQIGFSLENADSEILRMMNKHITAEQFQRQTLIFHEAGITTLTSIIIGYPTETRETILKTFQTCADVQMYPSPGFLQPYPGSEMYDYAIAHGYIKDEIEYIESLGERKELNVNLTDMSEVEILRAAIEGLELCSRTSGKPVTTNSSYVRMKQKLLALENKGDGGC